ncbi:MAG: [Fe-Fe] hydrogenase large subunit C-terminal domain-containing protein [Clostridium fessum]
MNGRVIKVAVAHGIKNAKVLLEKVKNGTADYQFIEIMACPGGCIGGGGNPPKTWSIMEKRKKAIYEAEAELPVRQSHKNPAIQKFMRRIWENRAGSCHKLLHTEYCNRQDLLQ